MSAQTDQWFAEHVAKMRADGYPAFAHALENGYSKDAVWQDIDRRTLDSITGPVAQEMLRAFPDTKPEDRADIVAAVIAWKEST